MKVVVTEAAFADLVHIGRTIGSDSPARPETFVAELYDRCQKLADMPRAFPLLPRWEERGVRRRPFGNYLIFYRVADETVESSMSCTARGTTNEFSSPMNDFPTRSAGLPRGPGRSADAQ